MRTPSSYSLCVIIITVVVVSLFTPYLLSVGYNEYVFVRYRGTRDEIKNLRVSERRSIKIIKKNIYAKPAPGVLT